MCKLFKRILLMTAIGMVLFRSSPSHALGPIDNNLDPTLTPAQIGDQKISGQIILIETAYRCLTIDRGNGNITRVVVDTNTKIARNGFAVDFQDLVCGNFVTIESKAVH